MELRHLRYFVAVAEELSFTKASVKLGVSQPPLTQQIKALEHEIGAPLFERMPRGVRLTPAGHSLLAEVQLILGHISSATKMAKEAAEGIVGQLAIGVTEAAMYQPVVTRILKAFHARHPAVKITLEENFTPALVEALLQNRLQVLLVRPFPMRADAVFTELYREPMMVAVPAGHILAKRKSIDPASLRSETMLAYRRIGQVGLDDVYGPDFKLRIAQRIPRLSSTINLVAAGFGISIVPGSIRHLRSDAIRYIPIRGVKLASVLGIAMRKDEHSRTALDFLSLAKQIALKAKGQGS